LISAMLGLNRNLSMLFILNLAVGLSSQLVQPLFPLYLESLGASEVEIGLVFALSSIGATALMLPSGVLIDRVGKKRLLLISVFLAAVPPVFISMIHDWRMLTPFFMVFSASFAFFVPARMALIAESAAPEAQASLFGLMNIAWPLGGIVGPMISGYIVERFGWYVIFLLSAAINALSLLPTYMIKERTNKTSSTESRRASPWNRRYIAVMILFFSFHLVMTTGVGGVNMILPLFLEDRFQLPYSLIGLFFTSSNVVILLTQIPSGRLADRYGRKKLILACIATMPLLFGIWPFINSWWTLLVIYAVSTGLWSMTWPATLALLSNSVPEEMRGTAFGIRMTGVRLGFTIGPIIAGTLYSGYGSGAPFLSAALFNLIGIPIALMLKENHKVESSLPRKRKFW